VAEIIAATTKPIVEHIDRTKFPGIFSPEMSFVPQEPPIWRL
jgi:hypothetical protein